MATGRPPYPLILSQHADSFSPMPQGTTDNPIIAKDLQPPDNDDLKKGDSQNQLLFSPHAQKKSFFSVAIGDKPLIIPANREPFCFRDRPAVFFFYDEIVALAQPFKYSMVGKFTQMPKMQDIRYAFKAIGLVGAYEIRWLAYKYILIQLSNEHDLNWI